MGCLMPLNPDQKYSGVIHRAKWTGYTKGDGTRGQALKFRVKVEGQGFADGELYFSDAAAQKSYDRIQEVIGSKFDRDTFLSFMRDPEPLMVGVECNITTKLDDNGSVVIQWINPAGMSGKPLSEDDERVLLNRLFPTDSFSMDSGDSW